MNIHIFTIDNIYGYIMLHLFLISVLYGILPYLHKKIIDIELNNITYKSITFNYIS
jgi:hypothetical protein